MVEIKLKDVRFSYRSVEVLKDVSLEIRPGSVCTLAGPNGSGKTTLLRCMNRILKPKGTVQLDQTSLFEMQIPEIARKIGYVSQFYHQSPNTKVFDAVLMGRRCHMGCFPGKKDYEVVSEILSLLHLESHAMTDVSELSGGQKNNVYILEGYGPESRCSSFR
jgi:iron complex transport system ATP-binding protein